MQFEHIRSRSVLPLQIEPIGPSAQGIEGRDGVWTNHSSLEWGSVYKGTTIGCSASQELKGRFCRRNLRDKERVIQTRITQMIIQVTLTTFANYLSKCVGSASLPGICRKSRFWNFSPVRFGNPTPPKYQSSGVWEWTDNRIQPKDY